MSSSPSPPPATEEQQPTSTVAMSKPEEQGSNGDAEATEVSDEPETQAPGDQEETDYVVIENM